MVELDGLSVHDVGQAALIVNKRAAGRPKDLAAAALLESGTV